ncbi:hypothetical protein [Streptomyces sp. SID14515]|uniref:hypothetical protein n=1 Tax=Streptomyces sp. SID14515 TaxID=2706074 RepID=UPI0013CAF416|nr:hypothetical protein [Streptomyces sp. SID14515]NEB42572.1 hypothetical protein [Streptomyces sp. SID14515]
MKQIKPDTRTVESMAVGKSGEWGIKPQSVTGKAARKRLAADAPKRKFAVIDGERKEVRQAPKRVARPYPSAPVTARPGSRVAATVLRGKVEHIPHLPFRRIGAELEVGRNLGKAEQANHIPFMPEFQAEGQPFPRISRDKHGNAVPRVRTDNGMTRQLQGRGIGRRKDGKPTYTKRQLAEFEAERKRQQDTLNEVIRLKGMVEGQDRERANAKQGLSYFLGVERDALAHGDVDTAERARQSIRAYRKTARFK